MRAERNEAPGEIDRAKAQRGMIDKTTPLYVVCSPYRWQATPADLPDALDDELRDWVEGIFFQFRMFELMLGCVDAAMPIVAPAPRRPRTTPRRLPFSPPPAGEQRDARPPGGDTRHDLDPAAVSQRPIGVPYEVLKFAPKKVRDEQIRDKKDTPEH